MNTHHPCTTILVDKQLIETALQITGIKTKRQLVEHALRELVRHQQQRKLLELKGNIHWEGGKDAESSFGVIKVEKKVSLEQMDEAIRKSGSL